MSWTILRGLVLSVIVTQSVSAAEFKANWSGARIVVAGNETKPSRIVTPWNPEQAVGQRRFQVFRNSVHEVDRTTDKPRWTVTVDDGLQLHWLDATDDVVYLLAYRPPAKSSFEPPTSEIRQLDLRTHQWLPPLKLPKSTLAVNNGNRQEDVVGRLLATKEATFVLVYGTSKSDAPHAQTNTDGYRICCFTPGKRKPKWSKEFPFAGAKGRHAFSLFESSIDPSKPQGVRSLSLMQFEILAVCAGESQDLIALDTKSGDQSWGIPRIWEFERGYIGPSVFEYYMGRFGLDPIDTSLAELTPDKDTTDEEKKNSEEARDTVASAQKKFDEQFDGKIIADPVLSADGQTLFVPVARGSKGKGARDCIVYQINDGGEVEAFVHLPSMVEGWPQTVLRGGIIWTCGRGSLVCVGNAEPDFSHGFTGAEDCLCPIAWYRAYSFQRPETWLSSDANPNAAAFTERFLVRTLDGGYIRKKEERIFHFPINVVRLADGIRQEWLLSVPFEGDVPWPEHGYSQFLDVSCHAHGPYFLYVDHFTVEDNRLRVVLKRDKGENTALDFDLPGGLK